MVKQYVEKQCPLYLKKGSNPSGLLSGGDVLQRFDFIFPEWTKTLIMIITIKTCANHARFCCIQ